MAKLKMERTHHSLITEGVREDEQTLSAGKPFWVLLVANIGLGTWLMGVLVSMMGLNFADAMFVILLGSLIGSALPAATAILGPLTRLSQMEAGRFALGRTGKKLPAFLNWVGAIGWDVLNNLLSTAALVAMLAIFGVTAPFWLALAVLVIVQLVIGVYGHHLIQETSKYTGILMGLFFVVIGVIAMQKTPLPVPVTPATSKGILSAFLLMVVYNAGSWTPYTADYTRYLPKKTPSRTVFMSIFFGMFLSLFVLAFFGYMTAPAVTAPTPDAIMTAMENLTGHFAPLVLFLIAFNSIPCNAINDNSAAYSLMSAGIKLSRPVSAIIGAVLGYVICLLASGSFIEFFENFLFFFTHWIAPWSAIILVHWFMVGRKEQKTPSGITTGCVIFVVVSVLSILLFSANSLYTGLLSSFVGGVDIGPYIGFVVAGLSYYFVLRAQKT